MSRFPNLSTSPSSVFDARRTAARSTSGRSRRNGGPKIAMGPQNEEEEEVVVGEAEAEAAAAVLGSTPTMSDKEDGRTMSNFYIKPDIKVNSNILILALH